MAVGDTFGFAALGAPSPGRVVAAGRTYTFDLRRGAGGDWRIARLGERENWMTVLERVPFEDVVVPAVERAGVGQQ